MDELIQEKGQIENWKEQDFALRNLKRIDVGEKTTMKRQIVGKPGVWGVRKAQKGQCFKMMK